MIKGNIRIYKDSKRKTITPDELRSYLDLGWKRGLGPMSKSHKDKISKALIGIVRPKKPHKPKKHREGIKGKHAYYDPETLKIRFLSEDQALNHPKLIKGNPNTSKANSSRIITDEYRRNLSEGSKYKNLSESAKKHYKGSHLGKKNPPLSDEAKLRMSISAVKRVARNKHNYRSTAEIQIAEGLSKFFDVTPQFIIKGVRHAYDMLIKFPGVNLLLEYDGDYYHSSRCRFHDPVKDAQRKIDAESNGYGFLIIKEREFKKYGFSIVKSKISEYYPPILDMNLEE